MMPQALLTNEERAMSNLLNGVHHTARPTWKLKETIEFYGDALGLRLVHLISARGWGPEGHPDFLHFFFDSGKGSTIAFFYYLGTDRPEYLRPRAEMAFRAAHTAWRVDTRAELVSWKEKLEARGVDVSAYTRHEVIESIYFKDPNDYELEITTQLRAFGEPDSTDARLTLQAAIEAEAAARAAGGRVQDIDTIWRRKGVLVEKLVQSLRLAGGQGCT